MSEVKIKYKVDANGNPIMEERIGYDMAFCYAHEKEKVQGYVENFYEPFAVNPEIIQASSKLEIAKGAQQMLAHRIWWRRPNKHLVQAIDDQSTQIIDESQPTLPGI
jgi:hypothetical protein